MQTVLISRKRMPQLGKLMWDDCFPRKFLLCVSVKPSGVIYVGETEGGLSPTYIEHSAHTWGWNWVLFLAFLISGLSHVSFSPLICGSFADILRWPLVFPRSISLTLTSYGLITNSCLTCEYHSRVQSPHISDCSYNNQWHRQARELKISTLSGGALARLHCY